MLLVFRLLNSLVVQTMFNPDEYWQSLEVAHRMVFGYGYATWEWQEAQLRGYTHPLMFAIVFKALQVLRLDSPWAVVVAPRLLQGSIAAVGDAYLYLLARRVAGARAGQWALFCGVTSWFTFYCGVRTFSNSVESVLTVAALYYWPLAGITPAGASDAGVITATASTSVDAGSGGVPARPPQQSTVALVERNLAIASLLAACAVVLRPTSALVWAFLGVRLLWRHRGAHPGPARIFLGIVAPIGIAALTAAAVIDRLCYGEWTFVPWNFVKFNVLSGNSALYGEHPFHWYFTQGFPAVVFTALPLFLYGVKLVPPHARELAYLVGWTNLVLSTAPHKEFRFVLPALAPALVYAGVALDRLSIAAGRAATRAATFWQAWGHTIAVVLLVVSSVPFALYMSLLHQRGPVSAISYIASEAQRWDDSVGYPMSVDFWMPCHSTPFYSHVHAPIPMRILDCSPQAALNADGSESDRFQNDPQAFLEAQFPGDTPLPTHVVMYDAHMLRAMRFLETTGFRECAKFFHSHVKGDADATDAFHYVHVLCR